MLSDIGKGTSLAKVLLLQNKIMEYRIPIFNALAQTTDLTVCYSNGEIPVDAKFRTVKVKNKKSGLFWKYDTKIKEYIRETDVIIAPMDTRQLDIHFLTLVRDKRLITWGIGVNASYDRLFDEGTKPNLLLMNFICRSSACLFYSEYPIKKYVKIYNASSRFFVANNTVEVLPIDLQKEKNTILFVGTLYKQKRIFELLDSYYQAKQEIGKGIKKLVIIGDGEERANIGKYVKLNNLEDDVIILGAVYDEDVLAREFEKAIACISPNQAGLSVLKSMGYGTPFITYKDAITGGERLNIDNGVNGLLFESFDDLKSIIIDIHTNEEKYIKMGENAYQYYWTKRTVAQMVQGFEAAIHYVVSLKCLEEKK